MGGSDGKMYLIGLGATKMLKLKIVSNFWHFLKALGKKEINKVKKRICTHYQLFLCKSKTKNHNRYLTFSPNVCVSIIN